MASIFTYDPDPPRVASPWREPIVDPERKPSAENLRLEDHAHDQLSDYGVDKLDSEPQDGPIEYKLHLLLRPRRTYTVMNTPDATPKVSRTKGSSARRSPQVLAPSTQSRQARLEQLTTQLLWRLQQTTPFHTATSNDMVIPRLPDDTVDLSEPVKAATLLPGLEASRGALYEIGVADDGSIKGLTMDEMVDSINTLKIMAASLGCYVEIRRKILVGDCAWTESSGLVDNPVQPPEEVTRTARLWVYEALVMPDLGPRQGSPQPHSNDPSKGKTQETVVVPRIPSSTTTQLRVTLTGPTTSGKSSLLGTLSTGTLDNGRGMSRLSLLKHRHEVASGITSSVAQELIGYEERTIINYADRNIESWLDIHDRSQQGRLVFVSDSAGHPRYRRTILRGIVGWAPHWTVLCIAGDETEAVAGGIGTTAAARDILGEDGAAVDLSMAHLDLCLKLETPLAILITKVDLPTRENLRKTLGKILTAIKDRGRVPKLVAPGPRRQDLTEIPIEDERKVQAVWDEMAKTPGDLLRVVPMVLTSAVRGDGIYQTHALLKGLPLPPTPTAYDYTGMALDPDQPTSLFHIDDKFNLPASYASLAPRKADRGDVGIVVSGYLRFGKFSVGDKIVLGPFPAEEQDDAQGLTPDAVGQGSPSRGLSISHRSYAELSRIAQRNAISASTIKGEWHTAQIVSIRNLRLPVYTLEAGQAGSIGIVLDVGEEQAVPRVRKGMILAALRKHMTDGAVSMQAASGFTLSCKDPAAATLTVGSLVNVYVASVRAAAKVTNVVTRRPDRTSKPDPIEEEANDVFNLTEEMETESGANGTRNQCIEVTLELLTNREWIEMGSKAILLEGGRRDKSGLEGIVGQVVEVVD